MLAAIPEAATPLVIGTLLALGALSVVLSPLLTGDETNDARPTRVRRPSPDDEPVGAVAALREIEFDRETGKLSDGDYDDLKQRYTRAALAELRAADAEISARNAEATAVADMATGAVPGRQRNGERAGDPVEAAIQRARLNQRACDVCGPRVEPDAIYCSSCGRYLPGACTGCGTRIDLVGSRFCSGCGEQLAAA